MKMVPGLNLNNAFNAILHNMEELQGPGCNPRRLTVFENAVYCS